MGQDKQRGTYEERKAKAIARRKKAEKERVDPEVTSDYMLSKKVPVKNRAIGGNKMNTALDNMLDKLEEAVAELREYTTGLPELTEREKEALLPKEPERYCGLTEDQWRFVIGGKFLCAFSDRTTGYNKYMRLSRLDPKAIVFPFTADTDTQYKYCEIVREPGIRQPWFGGEQPASDNTIVLAKLSNGKCVHAKAWRFDWSHTEGFRSNIIEFVYLEEE